MNRLSVVILAVIVVAAVVVSVRYSPLEGAADAQDERVIQYVFDSMLPRWSATVAEECRLPSRAIKGVLGVKTTGGAVSLTGWRWVEAPSDWNDDSKRCLAGQLVGRSSTPPRERLVVPEGREYEVDVDLTIPASTVLQ